MLAPSSADYAAQKDLRTRCVKWLTDAAQAAMLRTHEYAQTTVKEQGLGKELPNGQMGTYANSAALRAMAAVEDVHLVVVTTFTGPSAGQGFKGYGHVMKGRPFDRVAVYPPHNGIDLCHFKSWANDVVPVLQRGAVGVACGFTRGRWSMTLYWWRALLRRGSPPSLLLPSPDAAIIAQPSRLLLPGRAPHRPKVPRRAAQWRAARLCGWPL